MSKDLFKAFLEAGAPEPIGYFFNELYGDFSELLTKLPPAATQKERSARFLAGPMGEELITKHIDFIKPNLPNAIKNFYDDKLTHAQKDMTVKAFLLAGFQGYLLDNRAALANATLEEEDILEGLAETPEAYQQLMLDALDIVINYTIAIQQEIREAEKEGVYDENTSGTHFSDLAMKRLARPGLRF